MAATVLIRRKLGASPGESGSVDITSGSTRLKQADNGTADANNPVPAVGALGTNASVSCWVTTALNVTVAASNAINNVKWFTDGGGPWTGTTLKARETDGTIASQGYVITPTTNLVEGAAGQLTQANHAGLRGATEPVDAFTLTTGSPLAVTASWTTNTGYGSTNDMVVCQLAVGSTAAPGTLAAETITWRYDET